MEIIASLEQADRSASLFINSLNSPLTDPVWQFFSNKLVWIPLYLAVLVFFFLKFGWKTALKCLTACVLTIVICDQFSNLIKDACARMRPCHDPWMVTHGLHMLEGKGNLYGFFSAHAANAMGFALCSALCIKQGSGRKTTAYTVLIVIRVLLVGISRVFVGKHFLGDVLVGFGVGALVGWAVARLAFAIRTSR
ncbi:MAG: phosphatase PAP2 family protein [Candidatus Cryptobacteroides sp.]|nr:phosphatase PAP2 family protein [Rikenellaceae bacterium]MDY5746824.1 phosphatase PAP2 family protein [Candidatus Cryptobacteroides sp.]